MKSMHKKAMNEFQRMLVVIVAAIVVTSVLLSIDTSNNVKRNVVKML